MKTSIYSFILAIICTFSLNAQHKSKESGERREQLKAAKIGMITNRLNLTTEQAPAFWAIYNEYDEEMAAVRRKMRGIMIDNKDIEVSDAKIEKNINEWFSLKDRENDIEKRYFKKLQKVISLKQYSELKRSEMMFNQMLLNKMNKGHGDRP